MCGIGHEYLATKYVSFIHMLTDTGISTWFLQSCIQCYKIEGRQGNSVIVTLKMGLKVNFTITVFSQNTI